MLRRNQLPRMRICMYTLHANLNFLVIKSLSFTSAFVSASALVITARLTSLCDDDAGKSLVAERGIMSTLHLLLAVGATNSWGDRHRSSIPRQAGRKKAESGRCAGRQVTGQAGKKAESGRNAGGLHRGGRRQAGQIRRMTSGRAGS